MLQIPELLAPAGDLERLRYAINYGADAVYCGLPEFGMQPYRLPTAAKYRRSA